MTDDGSGVATGRGPGRRRVVVVTGASSGIGRASAIAFARRGDTVVLSARSEESLLAAEAECRAAATAAGTAASTLVVPADVTDCAAMEELVRRAVSEGGGLDVWVHSAAVMAYGRVSEVPARVFARVVETNLVGTANALAAVLPHFRAQRTGVFVGVTSLLGHIAVPYMGAYVSGKWGLRGLLRTVELELRDHPDVHVCAVSPGAIDTPIYRKAASYAGHQGMPPPPVAMPEAVARAVVAAADRPRRERSVGVANEVIRLGWSLAPPVFGALVGPLMRLAGLTRSAVAPHEGSVLEPRPGEDATRGGYGRLGGLRPG